MTQKAALQSIIKPEVKFLETSHIFSKFAWFTTLPKIGLQNSSVFSCNIFVSIPPSILFFNQKSCLITIYFMILQPNLSEEVRLINFLVLDLA